MSLYLFKNKFENTKVAFVGLGISNFPLIDLFLRVGAKITLFDEKSEAEFDQSVKDLIKKGVILKFGSGSFLNIVSGKYDYIIRSPGVRPDISPICHSIKSGTILTSEMEILFDCCCAKKIGITGSNGKSTTSTIVHELLKNAGINSRLGGNIGFPLLPEIEFISPEEILVLELSSFQLQTLNKSPEIAVITNVTPNHLNWHKDYSEYIEAKSQIFRHQTCDSRLVLDYDNEITKEFGLCADDSNVLYFGFGDFCVEGMVIHDGFICYKYKGKFDKVIKVDEILLKGQHNVKNFMAAILATKEFVSNDIIYETARTFTGLKHRNEFVRLLDGVKYYNSSIDSSPDRTRVTLQMFNKKVILICGGKAKGLNYEGLGETLFSKVKALILVGETASLIKESLENYCQKNAQVCPVDIFECYDYEEVVKTVHKISEDGDIVLLSPASTSYDMFKNFEERGDLFKRLVLEL